MKNFKPFIFLFVFFIAAFFYLYQKVHVCVEGYQFGQNSKKYKELVDKRDHLMYNFSKQTSLARADKWAQGHKLAGVKKEKLLVLSLRSDKIVLPKKKLAFSFKRLLSVPKEEALARNIKRKLYH